MDIISDFYGGYRFFGYWSSPQRYGRQFKVSNRSEVVDYLNTYNGVYNCGISVSTIKDNIPYLIYLAFDFDSTNLKECWDEASTLYNFLVESNYEVMINYSGYRGFHVLLSTVVKPYSRSQVRIAHKFFDSVFKFKTLDKSLFGDVRRLIGIPYTIHIGKFTRDKGRLGSGGERYTIAYNKGELLDIDELVMEDDYIQDYKYVKPTNGKSKVHPLPCVELSMNNEEPPQEIRYSYVAYCLLKGMKPEEIFEQLKEKHSSEGEHPWVDWDDNTTQYQINNIAGGDYRPLNCTSLKQLGFCFKECPYNIDSWDLKNINEVNKNGKM